MWKYIPQRKKHFKKDPEHVPVCVQAQAGVPHPEAEEQDGGRDQAQAAGRGVHGRLLQLLAGVQAHLQPREAPLYHR